MKKYYFYLALFPWIVNLPVKPAIVKAENLVNRYSNTNDTTYIINFWATWCAPCIEELPDFEKINETYKTKKVKVLLVSLDFLSDYNKKLVPFVKKKHIKSEVMLLDETKPDEFINKINPQWGGAIPATMIINNDKKVKEFYNTPLSYKFLEEKLKTLGN